MPYRTTGCGSGGSMPYGIYSDKMQLEKLDYMHNNPVTRKLVSSPSEWRWSSWRFYFQEDALLIAIDRVK